MMSRPNGKGVNDFVPTNLISTRDKGGANQILYYIILDIFH